MNTSKESQLAEDYNSHGIDSEDWGEPESLTQPARREVTLSVRFSSEEIVAIRTAALRAGVKPTTFIRTLALTAITRSPNKALEEAIDTLARDLDRLRQAAHAA